MGGVCLLTLLTHSWWLSWFGDFLVADEPTSPSDVVLVLGGDHRLQKAAELIADRSVSEVWLIELEPSYAVQTGILPADHEAEIEQLVTLSVPQSQIHLLDGRAREYDGAAIVVAEQLSDYPETKLLLLYDRINGRNIQLVFSEILEDSQFSRLSFLGLPDDEYDETNWWRSRSGWKETFTAISDLAFSMIVGVRKSQELGQWDPDTYERELISQFGEAPCHAE